MNELFVHKAYAIENISSINSIAGIINKVLPIMYSIVGIALFLYFVYGGFTWLMSAGEPEKINKARDTMVNAAIGAAIVIFAYFATRLVGAVLGFEFGF